MNWDDFRYILALSRGGTLTTAAASLQVTRTTVGRRLRAMETRFGARLFDSTPDGYVLTPAGQDLAQVAAAMEAQIHQAQGRILGRDVALTGRLRVSTLDFIYDGFGDVFSSFIARYPGVEVTLGITQDMVSLRRREADVAIRLSNEPSDLLVGRRLGMMQFALYGSRALVDRIGQDAPLSAFPWLHQDERGDNRWLDRWIDQHARGARVVLRHDDYRVMRASLSSGLGVCFLPCFDGDQDPNLVNMGYHLTDQARGLWILTLAELRNNSRVRAFMDHVYEAFQPHQALLAGTP